MVLLSIEVIRLKVNLVWEQHFQQHPGWESQSVSWKRLNRTKALHWWNLKRLFALWKYGILIHYPCSRNCFNWLNIHFLALRNHSFGLIAVIMYYINHLFNIKPKVPLGHGSIRFLFLKFFRQTYLLLLYRSGLIEVPTCSCDNIFAGNINHKYLSCKNNKNKIEIFKSISTMR